MRSSPGPRPGLAGLRDGRLDSDSMSVKQTASKVNAASPYLQVVLAALALAVVGFELRPALDFEFASDDRIMIVENQHMRDPSNWWRMLSTDAFDRTIEGFEYDVESPVGHWRPISKLSYLIDYTLWGPSPRWFHVTGILLHLGTGAVLLWLCRVLGAGSIVACAAAFLFVLHPLSARTVGLVSLRADLWCGLAAALSIAFAARATWSAPQVREPLGLLWASWVAAFVAMLSKETGLILPVLFTAWGLSWRHRVSVSWERTLRWVGPYWAALMAYLILRFIILDIPVVEQTDLPEMSAWALFLSVSRLAFAYLSELVVPNWIEYVWLPEIVSGWPDTWAWVAWATLAAASAAVLVAWRRSDHVLFMGLSLMMLPILPLLKIDVISGEDVGWLLPFEAHRLTIPVFGTAVVWSVLMTRTLQASRIAALVLATMPVIYAGLFPAQLASYRNTESMVRRKLSEFERLPTDQLPASLQAIRLTYQAIEHKRKGEYGRAEALLQEVLQIRPNDPVALKNLAVLALMQKQPDQTIHYLKTVLSPIPHESPDGTVKVAIDDQQMRHTSEVQRVLGQAYQMKGDYETAAKHLRLAAKIDPGIPEIYILQAWNAVTRADTNDAISHVHQYLRVAPPDHPTRGFALRKLKEMGGAPAAD